MGSDEAAKLVSVVDVEIAVVVEAVDLCRRTSGERCRCGVCVGVVIAVVGGGWRGSRAA